MIRILYYCPFSCSTATHIILEESGLDYQRQLVDLKNGQHRHTDYPQLNPKGSVPALQLDTPPLDKNVLTENQAIMTYLADQVPEKKLIPSSDDPLRARVHEWMNYCAASLHPYARSVFRPAAYAGDSLAGQEAVRVNGLKMMQKSCEYVEGKLVNGAWSVGEHFSTSDAYLYVMYLWSRDSRMGKMPDCPNWRGLANRVHKRPKTQKVIDIELRDRPDYVFPNLSG